MTLNDHENINAITRNGKMENSKMNDVTPSHILFYFLIFLLMFLIWPFTMSMEQSLMGNDMIVPILGIFCLIGIALVLLAISRIKYKFLMISLISAVYSSLIGLIYFSFLPTMEEVAEIYGSTGPNSSLTSSHGFDPSTVDFAFYNQFLLISLIFFISIAIISGIGVVRNERKKKCTKFKIVEY